MAADSVRWGVLLTAFLFHAPGLRLFYGMGLSPHTLRVNVVAVILTLAAMCAVGLFAVVDRGWWVFGAWAVGHVLWGCELARRTWLEGRARS